MGASLCYVKLVRRKTTSECVEVTCPEDIAEFISRFIANEDREHLVTVMLDTANRIIGLHTVGIGSLDCCIASPREVFKAAILVNAASIALAHNHPSGDVTPSEDDIRVSKQLAEAGDLLEIRVLDHVIVGGFGNFTSLRTLGVM